MGQCAVCKEFMPPGFTELTEDKKARKCMFCNREKDYVEYTDKGGNKKINTKQQVIREYKQLIQDIWENRDLDRLILGEDKNVKSN